MCVVIYAFAFLHQQMFKICQRKVNRLWLIKTAAAAAAYVHELENSCTSLYIRTGVDLNVQDVSTFTLDFRNIFTSILHQQLFTVCQTQVEGWGLGMIQAVTIYI